MENKIENMFLTIRLGQNRHLEAKACLLLVRRRKQF